MPGSRTHLSLFVLLQRFAVGVFLSSFALSQGALAAPSAKAKAERSGFTELEIAQIRAQMLLFRDEAVALMPFAFEETPAKESSLLTLVDGSRSCKRPRPL